MLQIGLPEFVVIGIVLLVVVGPEQLPGVIRRAGSLMGQVQSFARTMRRDFSAELDELERAANPKKWAQDTNVLSARTSSEPEGTISSDAISPDTGDHLDTAAQSTNTDPFSSATSSASIRSTDRVSANDTREVRSDAAESTAESGDDDLADDVEVSFAQGVPRVDLDATERPNGQTTEFGDPIEVGESADEADVS